MTAPILKPILGDGIYDFSLWCTGKFFTGFITALIYANIVSLETLDLKASYPILNIKGWLLIEKIKLDQIITLPSPLNSLIIIFIHNISFFSITLLLSCLSYKYIEKLIMKYKLMFTNNN